jgi:toxin-antitoxin system PIN domain toxin
MIILDANILLYIYLDVFPQHKKVTQWLEHILDSQKEIVGVSWVATTAFMRISTNRRIFSAPSTPELSADRLDQLFVHPMVQNIAPGETHWQVYSSLIREMNLSGDIVMDAHIAALAIENNSSVASTDKDFRRFSDHIKIIDPTAK